MSVTFRWIEGRLELRRWGKGGIAECEEMRNCAIAEFRNSRISAISHFSHFRNFSFLAFPQFRIPRISHFRNPTLRNSPFSRG